MPLDLEVKNVEEAAVEESRRAEKTAKALKNKQKKEVKQFRQAAALLAKDVKFANLAPAKVPLRKIGKMVRRQ
jgi:hypothetical protein